MKKVGFTMRVELERRYVERRDCIDQRWLALAHQLGWLPVAVPNLPADQVAPFVDALGVEGLVLTGGNTLAHLVDADADAAPERDACELALLDWAVANQVPCLGVCRGLQLINHYFGGASVPGEGHVATEHRVLPTAAGTAMFSEREVNSYHDWLVREGDLGRFLIALLLAQDGSVEAAMHETLPILGVMWHPEREAMLAQEDVELLARWLGG